MWKPPQRIKHVHPEGEWPDVDRARAARWFQPIALGPVALRRRTWVPAMVPWRATDEGFVTPLPYGTDTDWCLNWLEAGEGSLEVAGRRTAVANPRVVSADEALDLLPAFVRPGVRLQW